MTIQLNSIEVGQLAETGRTKKLIKNFVRGASLCMYLRGGVVQHFSEDCHYTGPVPPQIFIRGSADFALLKFPVRIISYNYPKRQLKRSGKDRKLWEFCLKVDDEVKVQLREFLKKLYWGGKDCIVGYERLEIARGADDKTVKPSK